MATAGSISAIAVFLMALAVGSSRAEDNCLAAPNARAPAGSHWHFHTDPIKKSKCWYLRTERQAAEELEAVVSAKHPTRAAAATSSRSQARSDTQPLQSVPATQAPASAKDGDRVGYQNPSYQAGAGSVVWPEPPHLAAATNDVWSDPPYPAGAGNMVWPDPPSPPGAPLGATTESGLTERATRQGEVRDRVQYSGDLTGDGAAAKARQLAKPFRSKVLHDEISGGVLIALAIVLVIAGMYLRGVVSPNFRRRHTFHPDLRETVGSTDDAILTSVTHLGSIAEDRPDERPAKQS
jgi:hypothetical protein